MNALTYTVPSCDVGQVPNTGCPVCGHLMRQEHAHAKCGYCGWISKCCE